MSERLVLRKCLKSVIKTVSMVDFDKYKANVLFWIFERPLPGVADCNICSWSKLFG